MNPTFSGFDFIFQAEVVIWSLLVVLATWWAGTFVLSPVSQLNTPEGAKLRFRLLDLYVLVIECFLCGWLLSSIGFSNPYWHYEAMAFNWLLLGWWWYLGLRLLVRLPDEVSGTRRAIFLSVLSPLAHGGVLFPFIALPTAFMFNDPQAFNGMSVDKQKVVEFITLFLIPGASFLGSKLLLFWCTKGQPDLFKLVKQQAPRRRIFRLNRKPQASEPK